MRRRKRLLEGSVLENLSWGNRFEQGQQDKTDGSCPHKILERCVDILHDHPTLCHFRTVTFEKLHNKQNKDDDQTLYSVRIMNTQGRNCSISDNSGPAIFPMTKSAQKRVSLSALL